VLSLERVAQHCAISAHTVERIVLPTVTAEDHRAPALRWGDPRTMAVLSALSGFAFTPKLVPPRGQARSTRRARARRMRL
jgi:hypothetical protein